MRQIDWSTVKPTRQPTNKERYRYKMWRKYLKNSRLTETQQHERAASFAEQGRTDWNDD